jgi:ubiquitin-conjugating enzyme E2 variant
MGKFITIKIISLIFAFFLLFEQDTFAANHLVLDESAAVKSQLYLNEVTNRRFISIGTSFEEYDRKMKSHETPWDKLMILGPTAAAELTLFVGAHNNLSTNQLLNGFVVSYFLADFIGGLYHFATDTLDWENPFLPKVLKEQIIINHFHHDVPTCWNKLTYWQLSRNLYLANFMMLTGPTVSSFWGYPMLSYILAITGLLAAQTHYTHASDHRFKKDNLPIINFLQNYGIIDNMNSHSIHHKRPHDKHFCALTGYTNFLLDLMIKAGKTTYGFFNKK